MIIDQIKNARNYLPLIPRLEQVFTWLETHDLASLENGKYTIDDDIVYAIVANMVPRNQLDGQFEAHRQYIDLHYVVSTSETIAYAPISQLESSKAYDQANDCEMLHGKGQKFVIEAGQFWIAFPSDGHWPALQTDHQEEILKVIVKIKI
jgi:biofilm protein TabA